MNRSTGEREFGEIFSKFHIRQSLAWLGDVDDRDVVSLLHDLECYA